MKRKFDFRMGVGLLLLSVLAVVIFRTAKEISISAYLAVVIIYSVVTLAAALGYIAINRGLVGRKVSEELLPQEWSDEEKKAFMDDYYARKARSKKLLIILVPMIATFFFEALDIYFIQRIISGIGK